MSPQRLFFFANLSMVEVETTSKKVLKTCVLSGCLDSPGLAHQYVCNQYVWLPDNLSTIV